MGLEKHETDIAVVGDDTTPGPAQPLLPELEEEEDEDEVKFREKVDDKRQEAISDYEMLEMALKKLEKELL